MYKYQNYEKLSKYFNALALKGQEMPNMTAINKLTGVSTSTISRYAIKRGYYSFPAMRANFNQSLSNESFNDYGFLKLIEGLEKKDIVVLTSISTKVIGMHATTRLKNLGFNARYVEHKYGRKSAVENIKGDEAIIFISITGESNWYSEIKDIKNHVLVLSTSKLPKKKNREFVIIDKYSPKSTNYFDKNKSVIELLKWLDDAMNVLTIEGKAK